MAEAQGKRRAAEPARGASVAARRPRWRRIAAWSGAGLAALVLAGVVAVATAPRWGADRVERELEERVGARLDVEVDIGELELSWRELELRKVELRGEGLELDVDMVDVTLDREALWSARFEVVEVEASGGHLGADRQALEQLARRLVDLAGDAAEREEGGGWLRRRTKLTPKALELRDLDFELDEHGAGEEGRRVTGTLAASVDPEDRQLDLRVSTMMADLGLGPPLRAASLKTSLQERDGALSFPVSVELAGASTQVDENIAVSGVHGSITAVDAELSELKVDLAGGFADVESSAAAGESEGGDLWSISGRFARDLSEGKVAVDMEAFELGRLPELLARLPLVESEDASLGGHLELDFGAGVAEVEGQLEIAGLNISHRLLAREVVRDVGFSADIVAKLDPAARRLELERLALTRGGVELIAAGEIVHTTAREDRRYALGLEVPSVPCQKVLDAIPRELIGGLEGFEVDGKFTARVDVDADFSKLDELRLDGKIDMSGCVVDKAPRLASAARLNRGFVHRVTMRDGRTRSLRLYPGSGSYTPLAGISRYMTEAVLTTEDGSFRRHDGFNTSQLEAALRRNLKAGKIRLGASTITMQMVKNVLLSHERTLSRKLQELFLTWWVEQALSKQRIMELYLNVIEFGPGIYGVTNAARHYFGKYPGELTSLEAAYLALMLPSPVRRHVYYCQGEISERFERKLHFIHDLMLERERITAAEHAVYSTTPIVFDLLERGDPEACLAEIDTLMAGSQTQRALSGLLGEGDASEGWIDLAGPEVTTGLSWGVRPPLPTAPPGALPGLDPEGEGKSERGAGEGELPEIQRPKSLEPRREDWRDSNTPIDRDPANSDAPGTPAMDLDEQP